MDNTIFGDNITLSDTGILNFWSSVTVQSQVYIIDCLNETYKWPFRWNNTSTAKNVWKKYTQNKSVSLNILKCIIKSKNIRITRNMHLPSMICDLMIFSNFLVLLSLDNSSKYSLTSVNTSFFGTNTVNDPFSFSNNDVRFAVSINSTNMLYCSFALRISYKLRVAGSSGRSTWCKTEPQLSSSK